MLIPEASHVTSKTLQKLEKCVTEVFTIFSLISRNAFVVEHDQ